MEHFTSKTVRPLLPAYPVDDELPPEEEISHVFKEEIPPPAKKKKKNQATIVIIGKEIEPIIVDVNYEVENGLSGLKRDILVRLINLTFSNLNEVRAIFGVCGTFFRWKRNSSIVFGKKTLSFRPNPDGEYELRHTSAGEVYLFDITESKSETYLLNTSITRGVYRWAIKFDNGNRKFKDFNNWVAGNFFDNHPEFAEQMSRECGLALGIVPSSFLVDGSCGDLNFFHDHLRCGPCAFRIGRHINHPSQTCMHGIQLTGTQVERETEHVYEPPNMTKMLIPPEAVLTVEADADRRLLSLFVEEKRIRHIATSLLVPFHLGTSVRNISTFTSVSFQRLRAPTPYSTTCCFCELRKKSGWEGWE